MRRTALLVLLVSATVSCDQGDPTRDREIVVSGAASLTAAFTDIGTAFEAANPDSRVVFTFGPSDGLATQIVEGAPVDVFASASPTWMDVVEEDGPGVAERTDFATNSLAILVPIDNPAGIGALEDLARPGVRLVLAAEGVPAGDYAREVLRDAGLQDHVLPNIVSNEEDVASVVTKVVSGDADAGIAYVTDATSALEGSLAVVPIPAGVNVVATYPIAVIATSGDADLAQRFVEFVLGPGREILDDYGFGQP
jgi:molybdate transport system substrate-binding protein